MPEQAWRANVVVSAAAAAGAFAFARPTGNRDRGSWRGNGNPGRSVPQAWGVGGMRRAHLDMGGIARARSHLDPVGRCTRPDAFRRLPDRGPKVAVDAAEMESCQ